MAGRFWLNLEKKEIAYPEHFQNCKKPAMAASIVLDAVFLLTVGSSLLPVELFHLQLCLGAFLLTIRAPLLTILASLLTIEASFCLQLSNLADCKSTASKNSNCKFENFSHYFLLEVPSSQHNQSWV